MLEYEGLQFTESISSEEIQKEVTRVASEINSDYAGREPLFVCVLNGAFMYAADLLKHITLPCEITFVRMKSYEGTETTGKVNMLIPLQVDVKERDVIVIEDIIDTGITMHAFKKADDKTGYIVRLFNPTERVQRAKITILGKTQIFPCRHDFFQNCTFSHAGSAGKHK